ncbi:SDR family NAD(P)-dependent oxidoreductase [Candidatus Sarmatiella mevalonica]|uniref:SDR family NAD(P)-dependent oxidoreductase n=1 Tax=Candidatus Sarmatiella mevalonica TaxID=2770581 RepID=UPI0019246E83|nr:SDR family oxidoreductase [Candidatus Sarmatiella mevalonica]
MITAATGAFGEALSFHFAAEKFDLILAGRDENKLVDLKKRILSRYQSSSILTIIVDFSDIEAMRASMQSIKFNQLDSVILIGPRPELTRNNIPSFEEWNKTFNETFFAPLECLKQMIPSIRDNGSIVIISGNSSKDYLKAYPNTNVIRLAWIGEVKNLMHFLAARKIRVNAISPGPILTKFHRDKITKTASDNKITFEAQLRNDAKSIPLGAYGSLDDVTNLVHFLISKKSKHINGANILLDGGESNAY